MTTITALRQNYVNDYLGRSDGATIPWTDGDCDQRLTEALRKLWPRLGRRTSGTVATSQSSDVYTVPTALSATDFLIMRIELEQTTGGVAEKVDEVSSWQMYSDTQVRIRPRLPTDSTLALRFFGWVPYLADATDLPTRLEPAVAARAAGASYGVMAAQLGNYQRQQALDNGRVVDYPTAVGLAAYYERVYFEQVDSDPAKVTRGPRAARR